MGIVVHPADVQDRAGAVLLFDKVRNRFPQMKHVVDWNLESVKHPWSGNIKTWAPVDQRPPAISVPGGFVVLKRRWVVERTFAWLGKSRRMSRNDEGLAETTGNLVFEVMIRLMVRRLAKVKQRMRSGRILCS
ncbi:hypothetical protein [Deinococcus rubellus]|uniref:hypothetical protein n=1 Tax=Deinococcus rubellus TaxID=1889240 RepID=UPI0031E9FD76